MHYLIILFTDINENRGRSYDELDMNIKNVTNLVINTRESWKMNPYLKPSAGIKKYEFKIMGSLILI